MKDLIIAVVILFILVVVFSQGDAQPNREVAPEQDKRGDGTRKQGEATAVIPSDKMDEPPQSPKTGGGRWWL